MLKPIQPPYISWLNPYIAIACYDFPLDFPRMPRLHQGFTTFAFGEAQGLLANHFAFDGAFDGALSMIFTAGNSSTNGNKIETERIHKHISIHIHFSWKPTKQL